MPKPKAKADKVGVGTVRFDFVEPRDPLFVRLWELVPYEGRVTSIRIDYISLPELKAMEERKARMNAERRHDAAVKANATRKARKAKRDEVQP